MGSRLLFSSQLTPLTFSATASTSTLRDSNTYQQFRMVDERISEGVKEVMSELPDEASQGELRSTMRWGEADPMDPQRAEAWWELWLWLCAVRYLPAWRC